MKVVDRFEASQGWVAVSEDGAVWRYRGRASAGVLVFARDTGGEALYHATHLDCFSTDTSLASASWAAAVRFAVTGSAEALAPPPAASEAREATQLGSRGTGARRADEAAVVEQGGAQLAGSDGASTPSAAGREAAFDILEALPRLSLAERKQILDRLLHLEMLEAQA